VELWARNDRENFAESGDFHVTFGFFYMPESTTWDRRLWFPSEGRVAEDFSPEKSDGFGRV
jgi:diadenosine tetraphosphatase ApaH/serine/threonine PP2A family protein phosphatase